MTISGNCDWRIFAMPIGMVASQIVWNRGDRLFGGIAASTRAPGTSRRNARIAGAISLSADTSKAVSQRAVEGIFHQRDGQ